ncbi:MAG: TonB-dependent receptor [Bacteroidaceae bacterium]|nr:TonB-dependent receptor [Bacteroidaceae bacterium]
MAVSTAFAQTRTIKGRVIAEADAEPLVGAAVFEKGSKSNGVSTDINGYFTITVPEDATLVVSYIGFTTEQVKAKGNNLLVKLSEDSELLRDVVVVGYGVQKKSDVTGAIASVKADDIKTLSTIDAGAALQGKVSGVQVINTGAPGEGAEIRVRGYSTNGEKMSPLYIVDGLKVDNLQYLDPSMIESIEILKDGASAAIYGVDAGNGVVLVTTKKGASNGGNAQITYSFKGAYQTLGKKADIFDAAGYIDYQKFLGNITDETLEANGFDGRGTDWYDATFEGSWMMQHSLTVQGGNQKGHFLTSLNIVDNNGIVVGEKDKYKRFSGQINADYRLNNWLKISTNNSIEKWSTRGVTKGYGSVLNSVVSLDPLTPVYYDDISECAPNMQTADKVYKDWISKGRKGDAQPPVLMTPDGRYYGTSRYVEDATGNPLAQIDRRDPRRDGFNVRGNVAADINPIKELTFTSRLGYRIGHSNYHNYEVPYYLTEMSKNAQYTIETQANNYYFYSWENFANFNKSFGKHTVGAMVGMSFDKNHTDNANISSQGADILNDYASNYQYISYLKSDATKTVGNVPMDYTRLAYFGRLSYSFDDRYYAQFILRKDACDLSKLSNKMRWGTFPSVSGGWTLSNEKFIKENISDDVLSFLKVRASWGRNGSVANLNEFQYKSTVAKNAGFYQNTPNAADGSKWSSTKPNQLANENLQWETFEQIDLGIDARFLSNRLTFGFDYFNKTTKDLILEVPRLAETGYVSGWGNAGKIVNRGFEFELGWRDRIGELKYSVNTNFSFLHNEVLEVASAGERITKTGIDGFNSKLVSAFEADQPLWYFYGYKYAGVDSQTGKPLYHAKDGSITNAPTEDDRQNIGCPLPTFTYGITINLEWKGFDFTLFGTGAAGNKIYNLMVSADRSKLNCIDTYWKDSWRQPGDDAKYPNMKAVATDWIFYSSSAAIFNGSYFKFKQIQLGYTFPVQLTKKAFVNNLRVFASLDDYFTITSYPGADPETASMNSTFGRGFDNGTYPTSKKVVLGASLTF